MNNIESQEFGFNNSRVEISFHPASRIQSIVKTSNNISKGFIISRPFNTKTDILHTNTFYDKVSSKDYLIWALSTITN